MKQGKFILFLLICAITYGFSKSGKDPWIQLFNGKDLKGWYTYIGPDMNDSGKFINGGIAIGLNNDPRQVFTVVNIDGGNVIRVSGQNWGAVFTEKEYENYHLQLQFKWGLLKWGQKKYKKRDSGLLYHSVGKYGADYGAWMRSQEFQIEEGNTGDYWGVAGGMADMPVIKKSDSEYVYDPKGTLTTFREGSKEGRRCIKNSDQENPWGKWNTLDLYCHGDTSIHVVNGRVVMILYNEKQVTKGQPVPLTAGKIQIQSEGAEVYYRKIQLEPIDKLPAELLK